MSLKAYAVALCSVLAAAPALAQTKGQSDTRQIDLKPLLPPVIPPPLLPPNSSFAPGAVGTGSQSPYSDRLYDNSSQSSGPAPGLRFSVPTR
jgi:hypothetical protein